MNTNPIKAEGRRSQLLRLLLPVLLLIFAAAPAAAQIVKGVVSDPSGEPLIGATIIEKGTTNGTATDIDGFFKLNLTDAKKAVLVVSYVGYATTEVEVKGQTDLNITLQEESSLLSEVVVVGYGQQKKESVVGAISQVNSGDLLETPSANLSQAITGKIPGVITSQSSGAPGADDASIYIRGRATFASDAQPLILVDGVERSFSQIAPDDIETISVLKDASATAVYGVRGANGVMLITTKRGKEQKPVVNLTASWQFQTPTRKNTYLNSYESVTLLEEALANDGLPSQFSAEDIAMYQKSVNGQLTGVDALLYPNVDWYDEILRSSAPSQRYNASVRGGTKRMRYYASVEYYDQESLFKNLSKDTYGNSTSLNYKRYGFRANADFFLTKDLQLSVNFGTRFEERRGPNSNEEANFSNVFYQLNHTPGWLFPVAYQVQNGDAMKTLYGGSSQYQSNIYATLAEGGYYKAVNTVNETNFILDYKMDWLTPGLSARGMMSFDYESFHRNNYMRNFATYELNDRANFDQIEAYNRFNSDTQLSSSHSSLSIYKLYMEAQLNYARKFAEVNDVTAMVLYMQNDYRYQSDLAKRYQGVVGRVTYAYDDRYLFEFNAGYNGSENFKKGRRFGFFPAFSAGWRITQEKFMESATDWLNNLKIRASYGQVGNDAYFGQRFLYEQKWSQIGNDYIFGTTGVTGIYEQQYPNYAVTWERAHKYNIGLEFGFLNNSLSGNIDFFYEKRNDILTEYLTRPLWFGVSSAAGNLGKTTNKGFEIELHYNNKIGPDFQYNIGGTFSHAKNKITEMDEPALKTDYRKREGHPINQYFGLLCDGFVTQADIDGGNLPVSTFGTVKAGDLKYRDMNGDGFIDDRDETFIGYSDIPENTYAINLGCNWKGIGLSIMFQGVDHVSRYYDAEAMYAFVAGGKVKEHHLDRWNPAVSEAQNLANAKYPLLHYDSYGNHNQRTNSFFLKDGSFFRLKNIELSYSLPEKWIKHAYMTQCRFFVNANNLVTWDHLDNLVDPESNGSNKYPICKTVNFGVNIQF
ncbi:MAG: TonB-dependent receptor [Muribaculaceae bacterium]|nr:TonB-dependent receptor [Muribaculaceae bacterium]